MTIQKWSLHELFIIGKKEKKSHLEGKIIKEKYSTPSRKTSTDRELQKFMMGSKEWGRRAKEEELLKTQILIMMTDCLSMLRVLRLTDLLSFRWQTTKCYC